MVQAASPKPDTAAIKPVRRPLPEHLPRDVVTHTLACTCPGCGRPMQQIGEDISEVLDYRPATFRVIRHVRRKYACRSCERIAQAPAPSLPIHRGRPSAGLLAHVLVAKYCDHLPLYRQSEIYARSGVALERSTLADWVGQSANLLRPLIDALERHVIVTRPTSCPTLTDVPSGSVISTLPPDAALRVVAVCRLVDRLHRQKHRRRFRPEQASPHLAPPVP
jgi:transposase